MLKFRRRRRAAQAPSSSMHPELRIRDLRDDPRLRRAMGLDETEPPAPRRHDRRRDRRHHDRRPLDRVA